MARQIDIQVDDHIGIVNKPKYQIGDKVVLDWDSKTSYYDDDADDGKSIELTRREYVKVRLESHFKKRYGEKLKRHHIRLINQLHEVITGAKYGVVVGVQMSAFHASKFLTSNTCYTKGHCSGASSGFDRTYYTLVFHKNVRMWNSYKKKKVRNHIQTILDKFYESELKPA